MYCVRRGDECRDYNVFKEDMEKGIVYFKESMIWSKAIDEILQTNFGKDGMMKLVDDKFGQSNAL